MQSPNHIIENKVIRIREVVQVLTQKHKFKFFIFEIPLPHVPNEGLHASLRVSYFKDFPDAVKDLGNEIIELKQTRKAIFELDTYLSLHENGICTMNFVHRMRELIEIKDQINSFESKTFALYKSDELVISKLSAIQLILDEINYIYESLDF